MARTRRITRRRRRSSAAPDNTTQIKAKPGRGLRPVKSKLKLRPIKSKPKRVAPLPQKPRKPIKGKGKPGKLVPIKPSRRPGPDNRTQIIAKKDDRMKVLPRLKGK